METFIYWCENTEGVKTTFISKACLDIGMTIPAEDGFTTIVDMDIENHISVYEDVIGRRK